MGMIFCTWPGFAACTPTDTAVDCCVFSHENAHFQVLKRTFNGSEHENRFHRASTNHRSEVSDAERSNISNNNGLKFRLRLSHERGNTRNFLLQMRKFLWKSRNSLSTYMWLASIVLVLCVHTCTGILARHSITLLPVVVY